MKKCPSCGFENPDDAIFCMRCGTKLHMNGGNVSQALENTRLWLTIAYIFSIVMSLIFLILLVYQVVQFSQSLTRNIFSAVYDAITLSIYALMVVFGFLVFQKVKGIQGLVENGKIEEADKGITLEWIVIAIIFNGVISGIFLLLSKIDMDTYLGKKSIIL